MVVLAGTRFFFVCVVVWLSLAFSNSVGLFLQWFFIFVRAWTRNFVYWQVTEPFPHFYPFFWLHRLPFIMSRTRIRAHLRFQLAFASKVVTLLDEDRTKWNFFMLIGPWTHNILLHLAHPGSPWKRISWLIVSDLLVVAFIIPWSRSFWLELVVAKLPRHHPPNFRAYRLLFVLTRSRYVQLGEFISSFANFVMMIFLSVELL